MNPHGPVNPGLDRRPLPPRIPSARSGQFGHPSLSRPIDRTANENRAISVSMTWPRDAQIIRCGQGGAQGRNRTTDTAIFSRMLYQLSYLGARVGAACLAHPEPPINPLPHAASGDAGGSSSSSSGGPGIRYCSPSQRPRSTSAHRGEQNGRFATDGARPQIGQRGGALTMHSLDTPDITGH
jgi:hypothetical protein